MAVIANRRSVMTLFSRPTDIHSHRTRLVLAEKNINIEITSVLGSDLPEDLMDLNPYHTVPTLVDRDLTLRLTCNHRVSGRALPASTADACRPGDARAIQTRIVSHRDRLVLDR